MGLFGPSFSTSALTAGVGRPAISRCEFCATHTRPHTEAHALPTPTLFRTPRPLEQGSGLAPLLHPRPLRQGRGCAAMPPCSLQQVAGPVVVAVPRPLEQGPGEAGEQLHPRPLGQGSRVSGVGPPEPFSKTRATHRCSPGPLSKGLGCAASSSTRDPLGKGAGARHCLAGMSLCFSVFYNSSSFCGFFPE